MAPKAFTADETRPGSCPRKLKAHEVRRMKRRHARRKLRKGIKRTNPVVPEVQAPMTTRRHTPEPRLGTRRGVVSLEGSSVPVWRLELARRQGSSVDAILAAFPELTREGLRVAFAYARRNALLFDRIVRSRHLEDISPVDHADAEDFEAELGRLLDQNAELYDRLAR